MTITKLIHAFTIYYMHSHAFRDGVRYFYHQYSNQYTIPCCGNRLITAEHHILYTAQFISILHWEDNFGRLHIGKILYTHEHQLRANRKGESLVRGQIKSLLQEVKLTLMEHRFTMLRPTAMACLALLMMPRKSSIVWFALSEGKMNYTGIKLIITLETNHASIFTMLLLKNTPSF